MKEHVSGWAAPYVDEETGEVLEEPRNLTQPFLLWRRQKVSEAIQRGQEHKKKAGGYAIRSGLALLVWQLHLGFWVSLLAFSVLMVCGLMTILHLEWWNISNIESRL